MFEDLKKVRESFIKEFEDKSSDIEKLRVEYLGRKGQITQLFGQIKDLAGEQKGQFGKELNELKQFIDKKITQHLEASDQSVSKIDLIPPIQATRQGEAVGHLTLITKSMLEVQHIFEKMGFGVAQGPEMEQESYNFDALNIPDNHPARDMWDTIWVKKSGGEEKHALLRTHTSPVQIRFMEGNEPPFRIISPGVVYRYEATDMTHETAFHQVEGLMVDYTTSVATFKGVMETFMKEFLGQDIVMRMRPSYFPFVEPGFEIDIKWKDKWLEVAGAGMVHRKVLENVGLEDPDLQGFAFGFGLERMIMLKYNVGDIRLFHSGDLRFLEQFR
jgi:phenylalanyl-tRNA synthetase alpha chain